MSLNRQLVTVQNPNPKVKKAITLPLPAVLAAPIRLDVVQLVHKSLAKNDRQPYAVAPEAGMQTSARSWGTGRAVSRIPRVPGGGTHRAGQGAFGNMCRGGRMFAPTKVYRKWHKHVSKGQRRYAVCSALAATAVPALVFSRGHLISKLAEVPLVVADSAFKKMKKTKQAVELLKQVNAYEDVKKSIDSKRIRPGRGKTRGRRYTRHKGPLIVHTKSANDSLVKSFRNIPGIELVNVERLNLLTLAPGGHLGRFVIWTESAFRSLNEIFGTLRKYSKAKAGFKLPSPVLSNADISRIINSDEVQSVLRLRKRSRKLLPVKANPLKNFGAMIKLNPYALTQRRMAIRRHERFANKKLQKQREEKPLAKKAAPSKVAKKTIKKDKGEKKKLFKTTRNASRSWMRLLHTPAVAPKRGAEEVPPIFQ
jgi:large subunit ribosomal protein L4e